MTKQRPIFEDITRDPEGPYNLGEPLTLGSLVSGGIALIIVLALIVGLFVISPSAYACGKKHCNHGGKGKQPAPFHIIVKNPNDVRQGGATVGDTTARGGNSTVTTNPVARANNTVESKVRSDNRNRNRQVVHANTGDVTSRNKNTATGGEGLGIGLGKGGDSASRSHSRSAGGAAAAEGNVGNSVSFEGDEIVYEAADLPVPSVYAVTSPANNTAECVKVAAVNGGGNSGTFSLSLGGTVSYVDGDCQRLRAYQMGRADPDPRVRAAAVAAYLDQEVVREAMARHTEESQTRVPNNAVSGQAKSYAEQARDEQMENGG